MGAGTHVSVAILHLKGEYDDQLKWPMKSCGSHSFFNYSTVYMYFPEGCYQFLVCRSLQRHEHKEIDSQDKFCALNSKALHLGNDCLTFNVEFKDCFLKVMITK